MGYPQTIGAIVALAQSAAQPCRGQVTLDWDEWGVAHVQASDLADAAYGNGWAQMEARGQTIATGYLTARSEAAACLGEAMLPVDLRVRQLGVPERAQSWLVSQDIKVAEILDSFTVGMNAWLDAHPARQGALACLGRVRPSDLLAFLQLSPHVAVDQSQADPAVALAQLKASGAQLTKRFGSADVAWDRVYRIRRAGLDLPSPVGRDELGAFNAGHYRRVAQAGPDQGMFLLEDGSHLIAEVGFGASGPEARGLLTYGNFDDDDGTGGTTPAPDVFSQPGAGHAL